MHAYMATLLLCIFFLNPVLVYSQRIDTLDSPRANNIIYGELASLLVWSWGSINYERMLNDNMSVRVGLGTGYVSIPAENSISGYGSTLMFNYCTLGIEQRLELGIGAAIARTTGRSVDLPPVYVAFPDESQSGEPTWWFGPAASIGYRYQPRDGGFFFRTGGTLVNLFGFPIEVSFGYTW